MYEAKQLLEALQAVLSSRPHLSLDEAARTLHVERHTIERACARSGGAFRERRHEAMVAAAVSLLSATPPLSIKEVAFRLGFRSPSAFTHFLIRATGRPPSQIRAECARSVTPCSPASSNLAST
jgi:AraC-like DNA-binding protein